MDVSNPNHCFFPYFHEKSLHIQHAKPNYKSVHID